MSIDLNLQLARCLITKMLIVNPNEKHAIFKKLVLFKETEALEKVSDLEKNRTKKRGSLFVA